MVEITRRSEKLSPRRSTARRAFPLLLSMVFATAAGASTFTVIQTGDRGNGSLRMALSRANREAGSTIIFAIPPEDAGYDAKRGVFQIKIRKRLPAIRAAGTVLDGATQFRRTGNTNAARLGTGGSAGVDGLPLPRLDGPEIEIRAAGRVAVGLDIQAPGVVIRGVAIYGFGRAANSDDSGDIRLTRKARDVVLQGNVIGSSANAFEVPKVQPSKGDNVRSEGAVSVMVRGNLIGHGQGQGIGLGRGSSGWLITENEIAATGLGSGDLDGIHLGEESHDVVVRGNLLLGAAGCGIDTLQSRGGQTIENNTIMESGAGTGALLETAGIRLAGEGNTISANILAGNNGAGVMVTVGSRRNLITRNRMAGNGPVDGQIGIDLQEPGNNPRLGTTPFVTRNDGGDLDQGGNGLLNYPLILAAYADGTHLGLAGVAAAGSSIEFFIAAPDVSGFGEGMTYLLTLKEGSEADADAGTESYHSPVHGVDVGNDTGSGFLFLVPLPAGVSAGTILTSTATQAGNTSEYGPNIRVQTAP